MQRRKICSSLKYKSVNLMNVGSTDGWYKNVASMEFF